MILVELFWTFFKIGAFTFGGGYAMLPLVSAQVSAKGWLQTEEIIDFIAISESTPGPFAVNMATYVGTQVAGVPGAIIATLGVVLPSFIIILLIAKVFDKFRKSFAVKGVMRGIKPCVVGMIAAALLSLSVSVFFSDGLSVGIFKSVGFYVSLGIFAIMSVLSIKKVNPIFIIVICAILGIALGYAGVL